MDTTPALPRHVIVPEVVCRDGLQDAVRIIETEAKLALISGMRRIARSAHQDA